MLKFVVLSALAVLAVADWREWGLDRMNPFTHSVDPKQVVPHRDYHSRSSDFDRFFRQFDLLPSQFTGHLPVDIRETAQGFDIQMDLPGVNKQDISVTIHKKQEVRVTAYKHGLTQTEDSNMHRTERYSGEVTRTMIFPENADLERLEAKYEDGVLWIKIPKNPNVPEDAPRSVLVN